MNMREHRHALSRRRSGWLAPVIAFGIAGLSSCADDDSERASSMQRDLTDPPLAQVSPPSGAVAMVTLVDVQPRVIRRDQPFVVTWTAPAANASASYRVQLRTHERFGDTLVWESRETAGATLRYDGPPIDMPGVYQVVVVARQGADSQASERVSLDVLDGSDAPASGLIGRYAMRTQAFMVGGTTGMLLPLRELALAEFVQVGDGVELRTRLCSQSTIWAAGLQLDMVAPEAYPELRRQVTVEGSAWHTDGEPFGTGFMREGVAECTGRAGRTVPKRAEQRWIRGASCRCPSQLPATPTLDDCRVTDPDGDGQPGLAYKLTRLEVARHFVTVVRSHPVRGIVDPGGRHSAELKFDETSYQLGCQSSACSSGADASRPCTSEVNTVQFAPLPEPPGGQATWTCGTLRASEARVFPRALPRTPSSCRADILSGP